jgi:hypothetical protein
MLRLVSKLIGEAARYGRDVQRCIGPEQGFVGWVAVAE